MTGALTGLLTWWVANDVGAGADEVHAMFCRLAIPGLRRFFAPSRRGDGGLCSIRRLTASAPRVLRDLE
jgi:hypothetical protein